MSSYQHVTGKAPKILTILPLGCRAYAVKPRGSFSKSSFESRAWAGMNLGSSSTIPGAYNIWLPVQHKVIQTSEVYFDESLFPWRPDGKQRVGSPPPVAAPTADPEDISAGGASPDVEQAAVPPQQASNLPEAFASSDVPKFSLSLSLSLSLSCITRVAPHCVNTLMILHVAHSKS